jgi:hypothetical protein
MYGTESAFAALTIALNTETPIIFTAVLGIMG